VSHDGEKDQKLRLKQLQAIVAKLAAVALRTLTVLADRAGIQTK
jgi:hypothetical protein